MSECGVAEVKTAYLHTVLDRLRQECCVQRGGREGVVFVKRAGGFLRFLLEERGRDR